MRWTTKMYRQFLKLLKIKLILEKVITMYCMRVLVIVLIHHKRGINFYLVLLYLNFILECPTTVNKYSKQKPPKLLACSQVAFVLTYFIWHEYVATGYIFLIHKSFLFSSNFLYPNALKRTLISWLYKKSILCRGFNSAT